MCRAARYFIEHTSILSDTPEVSLICAGTRLWILLKSKCRKTQSVTVFVSAVGVQKAR